jgi:hypothetical protein
LATSLPARSALVERTIATHPEGVTHLTAPHFDVNSPRSAALNVDLAEATIRQADRPVRAILVVGHRFAKSAATDLTELYRSAGVRQLELQMSPFGGEDESLGRSRTGSRSPRASPTPVSTSRWGTPAYSAKSPWP